LVEIIEFGKSNPNLNLLGGYLSLKFLSANLTSSTYYCAISFKIGIKSLKLVSLLSLSHVLTHIPFSGYKRKLSGMLSMIIIFLISRPNLVRS